VRSLLQPEVLRSAVVAALGSALVCYPRLTLWSGRVYPLWYLEALLVLGGTVLWGFVFAWYPRYTGQRPIRFRVEPWLIVSATLTGVGAALALGGLLDPGLRARAPAEYPQDYRQWLAMTLFSLGFSQVFLVFAPFAWSLRLFQNRAAALVVTVLFGAVVLTFKEHSAAAPVPPGWFWALVLVRVVAGCWSVYLYLRGGVVLVWWWQLLVHGRHLFGKGFDLV
jgi:hypothetical protein